MERSVRSRPYPLFNFVVGVVGIGTLIVVSLLVTPRVLASELGGQLPVVLLFLSLFIAARYFKIDIPPNITVSLIVALQLASIILLGPITTAWLALVAFLFEAGLASYRQEIRVSRSVFWSVVAFNLGMESLMTLSGGLAYWALGGTFRPTLFYLDGASLLRFFVMFIAFKGVNEGLMSAGMWFRGNPLARYLAAARTVLLTESATLPFALLLVEVRTWLTAESLVLFVTLFLLSSLTVKRLDVMRQELERTMEDLRERNKELNALLEVGRAISADIEPESLLETIYRQCSEILDTSYFFIALYEEGGDELEIAYESIEGVRQAPMKLRFGEGLTSYVIETKKSLRIQDLEQKQDWIPVAPVTLGDYPSRSWLGTPLLVKGEAVGVIALQNRDPDAFDENDVRLLEAIASQAAISVKNARLHQERIRRILMEQEVRELVLLNQKKSEFVNMVAHEFQSPLTTVIGFSNLILERAREGRPLDETKKYLELIHGEAKRLSQMVEELLNLSRIRSGKLSFTMQDFDVNSILEETVTSFSIQAEEQGHAIETSFSEPELIVHGDSNYLRRVVANLLSNAIKYTPTGGKITLESGLDGEAFARVTVRDTGPGIPEDRRDRIFDEFIRAEGQENREPRGTGLGLAITKGIVEAHRGRIWCESPEEGGAAFHFTVPLPGRATAKM